MHSRTALLVREFWRFSTAFCIMVIRDQGLRPWRKSTTTTFCHRTKIVILVLPATAHVMFGICFFDIKDRRGFEDLFYINNWERPVELFLNLISDMCNLRFRPSVTDEALRTRCSLDMRALTASIKMWLGGFSLSFRGLSFWVTTLHLFLDVNRTYTYYIWLLKDASSSIMYLCWVYVYES